MTETKTPNIFAGLEAWQTILEKAGVHEAYNKVADLANVTPPKQNILECFKFFKPDDLRVVLMGQDPYPSADACGLSFATNGSCPKSLTAIYDNFETNQLCRVGIKRDGYF